MTLPMTVTKATYAHMLPRTNMGENNENQLLQVLNSAPINDNTNKEMLVRLNIHATLNKICLHPS